MKNTFRNSSHGQTVYGNLLNAEDCSSFEEDISPWIMKPNYRKPADVNESRDINPKANLIVGSRSNKFSLHKMSRVQNDKVLFQTRKQYLSRPSKPVLAINNYSINYERKSEFLPLKIVTKRMNRTSSGGKQNSLLKI